MWHPYLRVMNEPSLTTSQDIAQHSYTPEITLFHINSLNVLWDSLYYYYTFHHCYFVPVVEWYPGGRSMNIPVLTSLVLYSEFKLGVQLDICILNFKQDWGSKWIPEVLWWELPLGLNHDPGDEFLKHWGSRLWTF